MWIGITKLCLCAALAMAAALATTSEVTLVGVGVPGSIKYPEWTKEESQENLATTVSKVLGFHLEKAGHSLYGLPEGLSHSKEAGIDLSKSKDRTADTFAKLASHAKTRFVLFVQVAKVSQKNQKEGAILSNLGRSESDTEVEIVAELYDVEQKLFLKIPSESVLKATYKGPYFGTTKKDEISGDPQAKAIIIRNENRKRMEAIGQAVWLAIRDRLLIQIKPG